MADDTEAREVMERLRDAAGELLADGFAAIPKRMEEAANLIARLLSDLEAARKRAEAAEMRLKLYEPVHTFDGLTIEEWKRRAEAAEQWWWLAYARLGFVRDRMSPESVTAVQDFLEAARAAGETTK